MVHHASAKNEASVPEELYNLTQLADVTLAAGKLSTETNDAAAAVPQSAVAIITVTTADETVAARYGHNSAFTPVRRSSNVCTTANAKTSEQQLQHRFATCSSSDEDAIHSNGGGSGGGSSGLSFSRNYAHKIFDRRKARQQQLTTTSDTAITTLLTTASSSLTTTLPIANNDLKTLKTTTTTTTSTVPIDNASIQKRQHTNWQQRDRGHSSASAIVANHIHSPSGSQQMEMEDSELSADLRGNEDADDALDRNLFDLDQEDDEDEEDGEQPDVAEGDDNDIHVCPECGKKYSTSSNLARHRQTHR